MRRSSEGWPTLGGRPAECRHGVPSSPTLPPEGTNAFPAAAPALQRPFRNEAPVLVETFMHILCGADPQQLLDSQKLLEKEQEAQREQEAAAKRAAARAAKKAAQQAQHAQQGRGAASRTGGGLAGRAAAANTAHLPRLPALPPAARLQLGAGAAAALARGVVPRHVMQAAPSRHAHSGGPCL